MARLRRSDWSHPGLRRRRAGKGFVYLDEDGERVRDGETLSRIQALVIPPAWEDVWICPWPNGHIQAIGVDSKGRRQYRYHDAWRVMRDRQKFDHVLDLAAAFPRIRKRAAADLERDDMPRERVLACAVRLLDIGLFRIGGEEYAEENGSFGLATLRREHTKICGPDVIFDYPAKSGQHRLQTITDPEVLEVVTALRRRRGGGEELLAYRKGQEWVDVRSSDINDYLREISGHDVSAKDFRTWNATVLAAVSLARRLPVPKAQAQRRRALHQAMCEVATQLGNTPTVCRSSYVDPRVIDRYLSGDTIAPTLERVAAGWSGGGSLDDRRRRILEWAVLELLDESSEARAA